MTVDVRVGTDVEAIAEVAAAIDRWGRRYTRRLFTEAERAECGDAAPRLTARFAAKEAAIKLLAPDDVVPRWRSIEVRTAPSGAPSLVLHDEAADLARQRRIGPISVSLSHGAGIGTATVVALGQGGQ
jgi:holo-[acyl-carrier protein] synthase